MLGEVREIIHWPEDENGERCRIVIIDTGVNPDLPLVDAVNLTAERLIDRREHGSLIQEIIHALLPSANYYFIKIPDPCADDILLTALNEAVKWRPHAINLSFTSDIPSDGDDPVSLYVDHVSKHSTVCIAAGNSGPRFLTIGSPAASRNGITVGGVTMKRKIWNKSSRGPTLDGRWKPNIVAPQGYSLDGEKLRGTSFSTPLATAAAALLMREVNDSYIVRRILELTAFSIPLKYSSKYRPQRLERIIDAVYTMKDPRNIIGAGLLDVEHALYYAKFLRNIILRGEENIK
ncbi:MAG: S8 family serine peptidase [Nitrososphaerota archaeon]